MFFFRTEKFSNKKSGTLRRLHHLGMHLGYRLETTTFHDDLNAMDGIDGSLKRGGLVFSPKIFLHVPEEILVFFVGILILWRMK